MIRPITPYNERRKAGAKAIIKKAEEMLSEAQIQITWVGLDYGLEIVYRYPHVLGIVARGRSLQVQLTDEDVAGFLLEDGFETTMSAIRDLIKAAAE